MSRWSVAIISLCVCTGACAPRETVYIVEVPVESCAVSTVAASPWRNAYDANVVREPLKTGWRI